MTNREFCIEYSKCYLASSSDPKDWSNIPEIRLNPDIYRIDGDGDVEYYPVGHNSDTEFCLGVDSNDNMFYRSYSCDIVSSLPYEEYEALWNSEDGQDRLKAFLSESQVQRVCRNPITQDKIGYIGHW